MNHFSVTQSNRGVRTGTLTTKSGVLQTPFFMPDATRASVRGLTNAQLRDVGVHPMVVNTYHLLLQPGMSLMKKAGGVHTFMQWDGPLLSDSGGYQVFSLIHKNKEFGKISEDGATFRSVLDGSKHELTPERSMQIQFDLGVDMMVVLDDPRPVDAPQKEQEEAVARTVRWAERCKKEFEKQITSRGLDEKTRPLLFGVVQGGKDISLREQCAQQLQEINFDGYGFGARHIDEDGVFMDDVITATAQTLPEDKPRFALGIGTPEDIVRCHERGWDMFDCVIPTREGRHGRLFVWKGEADLTKEFHDTINIMNEKFKEDFTPIDPACDCYCCTNYTRAYLQHLFRVGEPLGPQMAALHNLRFYMQLMQRFAQ